MSTIRILAVLALVGCGAPVSREAPDAGGVTDAGSPAPDGGTADTWVRDIQPLLWDKCSGCHSGDAGLPAFAASYPVLLQPSALCPGDRIGDCVRLALEAQIPEGPGCRTVVVRPFHREGWSCLTPAEIDRVAGWVDGGMIER